MMKNMFVMRFELNCNTSSDVQDEMESKISLNIIDSSLDNNNENRLLEVNHQEKEMRSLETSEQIHFSSNCSNNTYKESESLKKGESK
jgi:hypothetical protein